jgi:hypothetical protein
LSFASAPTTIVQVKNAETFAPKRQEKQTDPLGEPLQMVQPLGRGPSQKFIVHLRSVKNAASHDCA